MTFEWDPSKAAENLAKHGIPFDYATRVFNDPYRIEQEDRTSFYEETRYHAIGMVEMMRRRSNQAGSMNSMFRHDPGLASTTLL